jgi:heptosyltransferase-1
MRLLLVKMSSFGDVIHAFPALTDLAAARPDIEVDWLVEESFAALARLHPLPREIISVADRKLRWPPSRWPAYFAARGALRRRLRKRAYDLVVDLQGLMKSAIMARLSGAPVAGYDRNSIREPVASRLYGRTYAVAKDLHAVERNRRLLAAAIGYELPPAPGSFGLPTAWTAAIAGLPERSAILILNASWPSKLWPEENWRKLVAHLAAKGLPVVLPWGSVAERQRAERVATGSLDAFVLPQRLDGAELAATIARAGFAVGLDSGLMHLAAALGRPGIWLFGPTDPGLTGPYGDRQVVIRSASPAAPCRTRDCAHARAGEKCMDLVDLARVSSAVDALLDTDRTGL